MKKKNKLVLICVSLLFIGAGLIVLGLGMGAYRHKNQWYFSFYQMESFEKTYENISNLEFDFETSEVIIQEGEEFHIQAENVAKNFLSYQNGSTWIIKEKSPNFIGVCINGIVGNGGKVIITIPKDATIQHAKIEMDTGVLTMNHFHGNVVDVSSDVGKIELNTISANTLELDVETGSIQVYDAHIGNGSFDTDVGNLYFEGMIKGNYQVNVDVGSAKLILENSYEDFNYDVDVDMGNVVVGDRDGSLFSTKQRIDNGATKLAILDCDMGNITISFQK